jgi:hypothetical protein
MQDNSPTNEQKQEADKSVLPDAIDITLRAIEGRARLYRNLAVAVSLVSVLSVCLAIFLRRWLALAGLIILVPLTGAYLLLDSRLLGLWRTRIVEMVRSRGLDVATFTKVIAGFRHIPPNSLRAMLSTLSASPKFTHQHEAGTRPSVAIDEFKALERKNTWRILLGTSLLTLALICLISAAYTGSVVLLFLGACVATIVVVFRKR